MNRIILFIVLLYGGVVYGQSIETDRPDQTESSATVPKSTFQIESGIGVEIRNSDHSGTLNAERDFLLPTSLFRIGLVNRLELRIVNNLRYQVYNGAFDAKRTFGIDDIEIGFKAQIANGDGLKPQISIMSHLVLPTGTITNGKYGNISKILISHAFSNGIALGYNLGYGYFGKGQGDFLYSLAIGFPITEKLGTYAEAYGSIFNMTDFDANVDGGFTYLLKDNIQLDYSFGLGISTRMNYQAVGCSIRIPN